MTQGLHGVQMALVSGFSASVWLTGHSLRIRCVRILAEVLYLAFPLEALLRGAYAIDTRPAREWV